MIWFLLSPFLVSQICGSPYATGGKGVTGHHQAQENFDISYAAFYHPWLTVFATLDRKNIVIPFSGSVMGIDARSDNARGVHKVPANEVVRACAGLECAV